MKPILCTILPIRDWSLHGAGTHGTMEQPMRELREIVERHARERRQPTAVKGLTLARVAGESAPNDAMYRPTLCVAVAGRKRILFGNQTFVYDHESYVLATVDVPVRGCIIEPGNDGPFLGLVVDLDASRIADLVLELPPCPPAPSEAQAGLVSGRLDAELVDALTRFARLLDRPEDAPVLAPLVEREIFYRLLQGECAAAVRQVATAGSHLANIAIAAAWIRNHYAEQIGIDDLAAMAHMSVTSFHRHFKAITAMSPLQYRTHVRMQEARRLLVTEGHDAGAIGLDVGYESASQFSREYRRMFGMPPGADAARLRLAAR